MREINPNEIIDRLGGTVATAKLCGITKGAVSHWRHPKNGMPKPWIKFFKAIRPDVFRKTVR